VVICLSLILAARLFIITKREESARSYYQQGVNSYKKSEYGRAVADLSRAIEANPNFPEAYYHRGSAYDSKGEYERAISDYTRAIEINSQDVKA